jgi:MoxR-like ATPase
MAKTISFGARSDLSTVEKALKAIQSEIQSIIVGQGEMIEQLLIASIAGGHVLLEGVPGVAKTLTAKIIASSFDAGFSRIQFTPDLMPSDITGTTIFNTKKNNFEFKPGPVFSNFILIDEINRAPAKTQSALFEVMEEKQITVDGKSYPMDKPFMVIATQNPVEYEGTYRLPEAQVDRFLFKIKMGYPDASEEVEILSRHNERNNASPLKDITPVVKGKDLEKVKSLVQSIHVTDKIQKYIADLVLTSRNHPDLFLGGSPRASLSVMESSKACAALRGRDFVTPEDIQTVIYPALRHRLILTPEKEMEGKTPENVIEDILSIIEVPR